MWMMLHAKDANDAKDAKTKRHARLFSGAAVPAAIRPSAVPAEEPAGGTPTGRTRAGRPHHYLLRALGAPGVRLFSLLLFLSLFSLSLSAAGPPAWKQLAPLPDELGVAGAFAGVSGGALLVAGGANFPDKMPWDGGAKVWHDEVLTL